VAGPDGRPATWSAFLLIRVTGVFAMSELSMMRFAEGGTIAALILDATVVGMPLVLLCSDFWAMLLGGRPNRSNAGNSVQESAKFQRPKTEASGHVSWYSK
jgi:hypothetical protein